MSLDKVRIRFRKEGDLRLVSHHDLMRSFERMLRRAELPFRSTGGFHPTPRVVFTSSLPLGVVGLCEVVEIEFVESIVPSEVLDRLRRSAPLGITFLSARRIPVRQTAIPRRALYRLEIGRIGKSDPNYPNHATGKNELSEYRAEDNSAGARGDSSADLDARCQQVLSLSVLWVEREKPRPRRVNIRPFIRSLACTSNVLELDFWVTAEGTARADEVVRALGIAHLLEQGSVLERTYLEILDELDPAEMDEGPNLADRKNSIELEAPLEGPTGIRPANNHAASVHWGASPNGPVVE